MKKDLDPHQIASRLHYQVGELLTQLETKGEKITMRERVQALAAIGRLQYLWAVIRAKEPQDDERSGSTVKKYASAFPAADAAGRRKKASGAKPEPADWFEHVDIDHDDDGDEPA
jgi:hypothetical protein